MKKHETFWQVIQDIHIIQEGGCNFPEEHLLHEFISDKRHEFPDCKVKVYHEFWVTEHCSLVYENHLNAMSAIENENDDDDLILPITTKGDC